jgi:hypothetical protein
MGQTSSSPVKQNYTNFYHICNIIPDIPQPQHKIWTIETSHQDNKDSSNKESEMPKMLDHRYDLDISHSMLNMNLKYNGAYMIASYIYNILSLQFGYKYMLSIQMIYWQSIRDFFQLQSIDSSMNYKLSISSILDIVKHMYICPEKDFSIYDEQLSSEKIFQTPENSPFFKMEYYYVPNQENILKKALYENHLILANIVLFSTFLDCNDGVLHPPGENDKSAGMIVVTIVGYQENIWIIRFPFGVHWGDHGYGYISFDYFNRYNRDRWIIDIESCSSPPSLKHSSNILSAEMPNNQDIEYNKLQGTYHKITSKHLNYQTSNKKISDTLRRRTMA